MSKPARPSAEKPPSQREKELERENAVLRKRIAKLEAEVKRLLKKLEEQTRRKKRQASPFGKDKPAGNPKKPGRKRGKGKWLNRTPPKRIDETLEATLPACCPDCGGGVHKDKTEEQFQVELPRVEPIHRRFLVDVGHCEGCGKRLQGRHEQQVSDALGAASVQLGPNAIALAVLLNKQLGVSWRRVSGLFGRVFGLTVAASTLCRAAVERLGPRAEELVAQLTRQLVASGVVHADETGWRVNAVSHWLWVFANKDTTVHVIRRGRGGAVVAAVLGKDYAGLLGRDGWVSYTTLTKARHQTCVGHLLRRVRGLIDEAKQGQARFPHAVRRVLKAALALRDKRDTYKPHGFAVQRGRLVARLERLLRWRPKHEPNRLLAKHLRREADAILTFLFHPEIEPTNNIAERGVRPAVVNRKLSGGNRTERGALAQGALTSVIDTCRKRAVDCLEVFADLLRGLAPALPLPPPA